MLNHKLSDDESIRMERGYRKNLLLSLVAVLSQQSGAIPRGRAATANEMAEERCLRQMKRQEWESSSFCISLPAPLPCE